MATPFPGMDPYLEQTRTWSQFHNQLIVHIQNFLTPLLRPKYIVDTDITPYLVVTSSNGPDKLDRIGRPDHLIMRVKEEQAPTLPQTATISKAAIQPVITHLPIPEKVKHRYLKIRSYEDNEIVTVIEILSPANKRGAGRKEYEDKRKHILGSVTSFVEIDLLRRGNPMPLNLDLENDYRIMVRRWWEGDEALVYLFSIRDIIPNIPIPLEQYTDELFLPLNDILHKVYDVGGFDLKVDYTRPLQPSLTHADEVWVSKLSFMG